MPTQKAYTSPQQRRKRMLLVLVVIIILFAGRIVMMRTGVLRSIVELEPQALKERIERSEARVLCDNRAGTGTIVDVRKNSLKETDYTCTIVTAAHIILPEDTADTSAASDTGTESAKAISIVLQEGDEPIEALLVAANRELDAAVIRCRLPESDFKTTHDADLLEVLFSRDALARIAKDDKVYCVSPDGALYSGVYVSGDITVEGIGDHRMAVLCENTEGMSGAGVYDVSGDYLGMITAGSTDGVTACVPAADVMRLYNDNK